MTRAAVALAVWLLLLALIVNGTDAFDDLEQRRPDPAAILTTTTEGDTTP